MVDPAAKNTGTILLTGLSGPPVHVLHSHREASSRQPTTYGSHTVVFKKNWRVPESLEKVILIPRLLHQHLRLQEDNVLQGQPLHPIKHALYRHIKRRVRHSLKLAHCKGNLVTSRKQAAHTLSGTKDGLSSPHRVLSPLLEQHSCHSYRQHHSGCLHKQGGG